MLFETNSGEKGTKEYSIGICGLTGCTVKRDVNSLFSRLKTLINDQTVIAVQVFDSDRIATHLHLLVSALYALDAFKASRNISRTVGTEILLYASAQHQIVDALKILGVKPGSLNVAAVAISLRQAVMHETMAAVLKELAGRMDDSVLSISTPDKAETIKTIFGITEEELESANTETHQKDAQWAITRRVLSRISMMAISK
jgi:tRNA threonylcarbamoyladenosine modification (KEOPS) complex Cgi121 subunit